VGDEKQKVKKEIKKKPKKPEKSVFNKKSDAGKGDKLRRGISQDEWGKKYEKIFKSKKNKKHPLVDEIKEAYKNTNK
jgi:hypothetical protein